MRINCNSNYAQALAVKKFVHLADCILATNKAPFFVLLLLFLLHPLLLLLSVAAFCDLETSVLLLEQQKFVNQLVN